MLDRYRILPSRMDANAALKRRDRRRGISACRRHEQDNRTRLQSFSGSLKNLPRRQSVRRRRNGCLPGLFLIDKNGIVQHEVVNNFPLGRSTEEEIRMVDALQHFETYGEVCPMNWHKGEDAMKPTSEGVAEYLKESYK